MVSSDSATPIVPIELEDDTEGEHVDTTDHFFQKIGEALPITPDRAKFDLHCPPAQPLAVSERLGLVFVAHSSGFCVARTKDAMEAAKEIKEKKSDSSVQELSVVDVQIGKVNILALSSDSSMVAACFGGNIQFFSVDSLLNKDVKPLFECSLEGSVCVKDLKWTKKLENSYLLLSEEGKLYSGVVGGSLQEVMDTVDAVEWSPKGTYVAVAKKNTLSILSYKFKDMLCFSLSFKSWIGDYGEKVTVKVDSIRWVRHDCIIIGCFQLTGDGKEENYLVQIIRSRDGKITDVSSKPVVQSFSDLFLDIIDDIIPLGSGSQLFLGYIEQRDLAILANRKNMESHIALLSWSVGDEKSEAVALDIERDKWLPRIELQENGDDNFILGFCVDKVSLYDKVKIQHGVEDNKQLSPYCSLLTVTLEGKLAMFHVASIAENAVSQDGCSDEDDSPSAVHIENDLSEVPSQLEKQSSKQLAFDVRFQDPTKKELNIEGGSEVPKPLGLQSPASTIVSNHTTHKVIPVNQEANSLVNSQVSGAAELQTSHTGNIYQDMNAKKSWLFSQQSKNLEQSSSKTVPVDHSHGTNSFSLTETQKAVGFGSNFASGEKFPTAISGNLNVQDSQILGVAKETSNFQVVSSQARSTGKLVFSENPKPLSTSTVQGNESENSGLNICAENFPGTSAVKPLFLKGTSAPLSSDASTGMPAQRRLSDFAGSVPVGHSHGTNSFSMTETQKVVGFGSSLATGEKFPTATSVNLNVQDSQILGVAKEISNFQVASSQAWSTGKLVFSENPKPLLTNSVQGNKSENSGPSIGAENFPGTSAVKPLYSKDTSAPLSSDASTGTSGQRRLSDFAGSIENLTNTRRSQLLSQENDAFGKSSNYKLDPSKENLKTPPSVGLRTSEPKFAKQFGNIKEMTTELDTLLECIEEAGGFRDACTVFQQSSVEALEQGIQTLYNRCRMWKTITDKELGEMDHLLDKTVQVLARKMYMEGVVKQATDSQYLDLWNRQKLSSELELKQRHILKLNRDLTNQLIELERHFNTLELNKFGENGVPGSRKVSQSRFGTSRHTQSLHTLHNTMGSQLAAAEQLSNCLSKQMAVLSIESPSGKQHNVKKELFETIGIPYDYSFSSPDAAKPSDTPSAKKLLLSSCSSTNKDQFRRNQSSAMKSHEPETARRRRDSLDRSLATLEPPKTTVKRMVLVERQKVSSSKLPFSMDKQHFSPHSVNRTEVTRPVDLTNISTFTAYPSGNKDMQGLPSKQAPENSSTLFRWASEHPGQPQSSGLVRPSLQAQNVSSLLMPLAARSSHSTGQHSMRQSSDLTMERSISGAMYNEKSSESTLTSKGSVLPESETKLQQISASIQSAPLIKKSSEQSSLNTTRSANFRHATTESFISDPSKSQNLPFSSSSVATPSNLPGKPLLFGSTSKNESGEKVSSSPTYSLSVSAPSSTVAMSSTTPQLPSSIHSSAALISSSAMASSGLTSFSVTDYSKKGLPTPTSSKPPSAAVSSSFFPLKTPETLAPSFIPSSVSLVPNFQETDVKSPQGQSTSNTQALPQPLTNEPSYQLEPSVSSASATVASTGVVPGSHFDLNKASLAPNATETSIGVVSGSQFNFGKASSAPNTADTSTGAVSKSPFSFNNANSVSNATQTSARAVSGSQFSFNKPSSAPNETLNVQPVQPSAATLPVATSSSEGTATVKNESSDVTVNQEDEMEEEAPDSSQTSELNFGSVGGFGLGSTPSPAAPKSNPFGGPFGNTAANPISSPFSMATPAGELFRPASFSFQPIQTSQPPQQANMGAFSGGFGSGTSSPAPNQGGFGQAAQIGQGQQALGSVLGSFGQSRQIGAGGAGAGFASPSSLGSGFSGTSPGGGFSSAATGGGFAGVASPGGGFANLASGGGGFGGITSGGGGFGGMASGGLGFGGAASSGVGGFAGAASGGGFAAAGGGGFGAFGGNQGSGVGGGGFSSFGSGGAGKPPQLFTQIRK